MAGELQIFEDSDPYAEGAEAYESGCMETENPYDIDADPKRHMSWNDGWEDAQDQAESDD